MQRARSAISPPKASEPRLPKWRRRKPTKSNNPGVISQARILKYGGSSNARQARAIVTVHAPISMVNEQLARELQVELDHDGMFHTPLTTMPLLTIPHDTFDGARISAEYYSASGEPRSTTRHRGTVGLEAPRVSTRASGQAVDSRPATMLWLQVNIWVVENLATGRVLSFTVKQQTENSNWPWSRLRARDSLWVDCGRSEKGRRSVVGPCKRIETTPRD